MILWENDININEELSGKTIEFILRKRLCLSSSLIARLKRQERGVLLNKMPVKVIDKVKNGDVLTVAIAEKQSDIQPQNIPLDILYEDENILVVDKPSGMLTHPSGACRENTLANAVLGHIGGGLFHPITRLDKETSGVVLIAKNVYAAAILTESIKNCQVQKEYVALLCGSPNPPRGIINAPILSKSGSMQRYVHPDGKSAITKYETIEGGDISLVRLWPVTGRTHQLRVHTSHMKTPIYGDKLYGAPFTDGRVRLHCRKISFCFMGKKISAEAPFPKDMLK